MSSPAGAVRGAPRRWTLPTGIEVVGESWGDPTDPLVLLLHGGGQTRHAWQGARRTLSEVGFHSVAVDTRGHGESGWAPDGNYDQDALVADVVELVDQIGAPAPALVGASMGGATALVAVGEGHVTASALVLVDIGPVVEADGAARIREFVLDRPEGFASLDEVADAVAAYLPHRPRPARPDGLARNVRLGADGRYRWHWDPRYYDRTPDLEAREARLSAASARVDVPTLLVRGGLSDLLSERAAARFLELCPHAEYVNITGAAHMVPGERNDVFGGAVVDFLRSRRPA